MLRLDGSKLSCIVLAAGKSRRMGSNNKLLLQFKGKELIKHILEKIIKQDFFEIIVVSGWQSQELEKVLMEYPVKVIYNPKYLEGQSTSLKKALDTISDKTLGAFFVLGDQPLVKEDTIKDLMGKFLKNPNCLVAPYYNGKRGNPVVIPRRLFSKLNNLQGDKGARNLFLDQDNIIKLQVEDKGVVLDIDTPEDYEKLLEDN
ncbi:MAG: hypothetical protein APF76_09105 [Desulfitibacter sp. BRH_c19]|nr:MAG: hypothetical protein APF76_09105 [Desulfitibacter sp. BRH_c19]